MVDNAMDASPTRSSALAMRNRVSRRNPESSEMPGQQPMLTTSRTVSGNCASSA